MKLNDTNPGGTRVNPVTTTPMPTPGKTLFSILKPQCLLMPAYFTDFNGVLISGGHPTSSRRKVELYDLINKTSCDLPDLPASRHGHTSVGGVICGGHNAALTSCVDISSGSWSSSKYQEIRNRSNHVVWDVNPGKYFMLLGGRDSTHRQTTDIVHYDGTVEPGFNLPYISK